MDNFANTDAVDKASAESKRPSRNLPEKVLGGVAFAGLLVSAVVYEQINQTDRKSFEHDQQIYDEMQDVIGREFVSIPWDTPNSDAVTSAEAIKDFGDSVGVDLVPAKWTYSPPADEDSAGTWTYVRSVDFYTAKETVDLTIGELETRQGWEAERRQYFVKTLERQASGGRFGNELTNGEAILKLEQALERPAGFTRDTPSKPFQLTR